MIGRLVVGKSSVRSWRSPWRWTVRVHIPRTIGSIGISLELKHTGIKRCDQPATRTANPPGKRSYRHTDPSILFERIRQTLEKAGGKLDDIVTMTVFITDMANGTRFTQLRKEFFQEGRYPASALIGIKELARPEMMVEIQAIAVVD